MTQFLIEYGIYVKKSDEIEGQSTKIRGLLGINLPSQLYSKLVCSNTFAWVFQLKK